MAYFFVNILFFVLCLSRGVADSIRIQLLYRPAQVSLNRYEQLFIADIEGNLYQYDTNLKLIQTFSPQKKSFPTILEAWETMRIFVFFQELQEYVLLNRILGQPENNRFRQENIHFVRAATLSADGNLWLFDEIDFTLKKYQFSQKNILIASPLDLTLLTPETDIRFMREYQNKLFIAEKAHGILVFDNMGNYLETIPAKGVEWFSFYENSLIFKRESHWVVHHLYTHQEKNISAGNAIFMILTSTKRIEIFDDCIKISF
ncbi:MAG: hypothetical protein NZM38_00105 [Cytophagales bacterium]|nr:hypothetical protein [Cytophagales bacterium]MDW8383151.1 hypothetical protein [Flammeovirgaceae bacterium]